MSGEKETIWSQTYSMDEECWRLSKRKTLIVIGYDKDYLSHEEFLELKRKYTEFNNNCKDSIIYHVGTGAGLYSELGSMLECMVYCYINKIKFVLYADDANFSNNGWTDFLRSSVI